MRNKIIAYLAKYLLKAIMLTCRVEIIGRDKILEAAKAQPLILMLWHNRLAALPEILYPVAAQHKFAAFVSKSRDGEMLSQLVLSYKGGTVIRVPHNGRDKALKIMIETLNKRDEIVIITPDGPRGPLYELKPGVLFAAKATGSAIIGFTWEADKFFELKSWDKFRLPRPFTKIRGVFGDVIQVTAHTTLADLKSHLIDL